LVAHIPPARPQYEAFPLSATVAAAGAASGIPAASRSARACSRAARGTRALRLGAAPGLPVRLAEVCLQYLPQVVARQLVHKGVVLRGLEAGEVLLHERGQLLLAHV